VLALLPINNVWLNLFIKKIIPLLGLGVAIAGFLDEISLKAGLYDKPTNGGIAKKVQDISGCKSVKIKPVFDSSVIGGYMVDIGGKRIDMTIKAKLKAMERELSSGADRSIADMMGKNMDVDKLLPSAESLMPAAAIR